LYSIGKWNTAAEKNTTHSFESVPKTVRVFDYLDYRAFLRDLYQSRKAADARFSCRFIAQRVGFRSASYFTQVLNGRVGMTTEMALRFAAFLKLEPKEADYLELLVLHQRAKTVKERRRYLEKLGAFRESRADLVPPEHYEYFAKWYHTAVRELLHIRPFDGDHKALGKALRPSIPAARAKESIELLLRLGLARREKGLVVRSDQRNSSTGEAVQAVQVDQFHASTLQMAARAIEGCPRAERSLSSLTMTLSREGRARVEAEIVEFRRRVQAIAHGDHGETMVHHLGIQMFPMSRESIA
jgi:uncharacterized protein (TIGR02147 family)